MVLQDKRIVLGVTGGIAAYKAIEVCRRLVDAGAHVVPVLTENALKMVTTTTFSVLASEPAQTSLFEGPESIPHTRLGQQADLIVIAPATARLIGSYTAGISDDLLTATLLATRAPVLVCPAMHTEMWEHPAVQANLGTLRSRGVHVLDPEMGRLAGGDVGAGRLADPAAIVAEAMRVLGPNDFAGVDVVVTAGGTREPIDPVRFIGNRSSGKQGHAIAAEAVSRGAHVTLITSANVGVPHGCDVVNVSTAAEMSAAVEKHETADVVVMAAAVADFRPSAVEDAKIKKGDGIPEILLEPTTDILAGLGAKRHPGQVIVGFAAETSDVEANARAKLKRKNADMIVSNDVSAAEVGFAHETNAVTIHLRDGTSREIGLGSKSKVARSVLDAVAEMRNQF